MAGKTAIWMITAIAFVLIGCVLFGIVMVESKWDFTNLSTVEYETNTHSVTDAYTQISIATDTADIVLAPSEDGNTSVVCYEQTDLAHRVLVQDGTLCVELLDDRKWYDYIGIHFGAPSITVYLPAGVYGDLKVAGSTCDLQIQPGFTFENMDVALTTGDIHMDQITATSIDASVSTGYITASSVTCDEDMTIRVSTGDVALAEVQCRNLITNGNTGDLTLSDTVATESISVTRTTGDVQFDSCDATALSIVTDTGDVSGSLRTDKVFVAHTDTGRVRVPSTTTGGRCEITTDTGDITIIIL